MLVESRLRFLAHVRKAGALAGEFLRSTVCRSSYFMVSMFVSHPLWILVPASGLWATWVILGCWNLFREEGQTKLLELVILDIMRD